MAAAKGASAHAVRSGGVPQLDAAEREQADAVGAWLHYLRRLWERRAKSSRRIISIRSGICVDIQRSPRHRRRQVALRPAPLSDQRNANRVRSARGFLRGVLSRPPQGRCRGSGGGRPAQRLRTFPGQRHSGAACAVCIDRSAVLPNRTSLGARRSRQRARARRLRALCDDRARAGPGHDIAAGGPGHRTAGRRAQSPAGRQPAAAQRTDDAGFLLHRHARGQRDPGAAR